MAVDNLVDRGRIWCIVLSGGRFVGVLACKLVPFNNINIMTYNQLKVKEVLNKHIDTFKQAIDGLNTDMKQSEEIEVTDIKSINK